MKKMVCSVCSYTYDEATGIPEAGIAPGTPWENLPEQWKCPWCGAGKEKKKKKKEEQEEAGEVIIKKPHEERELSAMELSVICSNLARGCEKQYLLEESENFHKLADFFKTKAESSQQDDNLKILELLEKDLSVHYPYANARAGKEGDRGALRCLVWSEKVTRMQEVLLKRYRTEGEKMLQNTGVYVCTVCGFIYLGDAPPKLCPVCKVPDWKFERIERRA